MSYRLEKENSFFLSDKGACYIIRLLQSYGAEAYFVGGCVRSAVMRQSNKEDDIDITTSFTPQDMIRICDQEQVKYVPTGVAFGTVTIVREGKGYQVTTFREDVQTDGRHAVVRFTTDYMQDALRRDFTMNAIYCDLQGNIFSPVDGIEDALKKQVRFIGHPEARIKEDYLRILRYYRFIAGYGLAENCEIVSQLCQDMSRDMICPSAERNLYELSKLVMLPFALETLKIMKRYSILEAFFHNTICDIEMLQKNLALQKEFFVIIPAFLRIFILFGKDILEQTKIFRFSRSEIKEIKDILKVIHLLEHSIEAVNILDMRYDYADRICRIAVMIYSIKYSLSDTIRQKINMLLNTTLPDFNLTGLDMMAQGIKGKAIKDMLRMRRLEILEDFIRKNYFHLEIR